MANTPGKDKPYRSAPSNYNVYPTKMPIDKGWGVKPNDKKSPGKFNARFVNQNNEVIEFYVTDIGISSNMGGNVAQSRNVQQFFPYNFVQPVIQIAGITRNSFQYNRLANFVRQSHNLALNGSGNPLVSFAIMPSAGGFRSSSQNFPYAGGRTTKGKHGRWFARGYIESFGAGGRKENHAPEFQIDFAIAAVVAQGADGKGAIMDDQTASASDMKGWMEYFWGLSKNDVKKQFYSPPSEPAKKPPKVTGNNPQKEENLTKLANKIRDAVF